MGRNGSWMFSCHFPMEKNFLNIHNLQKMTTFLWTIKQPEYETNPGMNCEFLQSSKVYRGTCTGSEERWTPSSLVQTHGLRDRKDALLGQRNRSFLWGFHEISWDFMGFYRISLGFMGFYGSFGISWSFMEFCQDVYGLLWGFDGLMGAYRLSTNFRGLWQICVVVYLDFAVFFWILWNLIGCLWLRVWLRVENRACLCVYSCTGVGLVVAKTTYASTGSVYICFIIYAYIIL